MTLLSRLIRLPLRLVPPEREVPILSGELRGWRWITGAATHGCWLGTYEREAQRVFRDTVREGDVVLDVGANAGFFTLLAAKRVGPRGMVYAFEPLPRNLEYLRRHVAANGLANVQVLPLALSSRAGVARFGTAASPAMGRLSEDGEVEVRTEALDDLVASGRVAPPQFIKMDVEGAEYEVLTGAASVMQRERPVLLLSTHGWREHERCCTLLRDWGYTLTLIRDGARDGQYTLLATVI
jgi:FkbM family methyltransferase